MIFQRGTTYHFKRRVPKRFAKFESREFVTCSLHTDSFTVAEEKAAAFWAAMIEGWEAEADGRGSIAEERFAAAKKFTERQGFRWVPVDHVASLPVDQVVARVEAAEVVGRGVDKFRSEALLGGAVRPELTVSRVLDDFWNLSKDKNIGKSEDQIRRWRNPRLKAFRNFIDVVGNKVIGDITADDMLDFRAWWWDRIESEGLTVNSANKDFTHFASVIKTVIKLRRLDIEPPLTGLAFSGDQSNPRPPFSTDFIREKLLAPNALVGLNTEAKTVLLGMVNTGYRPSEGANLTVDRIRLDANIPHIQIRADGRVLKTRRAERDIPLVGVSLEAFRQCPGGSPRYQDNPSLSATLNKFLRSNGLTESPRHTVYSLRHSFEDRLLVAGVDERVRRDLMGHRLDREEYGVGGGLPVRLRAIEAIAI